MKNINTFWKKRVRYLDLSTCHFAIGLDKSSNQVNSCLISQYVVGTH